jgi:hypothetical protein
MRTRPCALGLALLLPLLGCGGGSSPTEAFTTPPPATLPTPVPAAPEPVVTNGCGQAPGRGNGIDCGLLPPEFLGDFERAMDVVAQETGLVDPGSFYRVTNKQAYVEAMVKQLRKQGFCAFFDGAEFAIKRTNAFSEQYVGVLSTGTARRGEKAHKATCIPAWSAIP